MKKLNSLIRVLQILALLCVIGLPAYANVRFLTVSDIHYGAKNSSQEGTDTGDKLLALTVNKIKELSKDVDFILYLGDLPTHLWGYSAEKAGYEQTVFHNLFLADALKKPMFYISGNNDALAGNYQPFETNGKSPLSYAKDWNGACVYCKELLIDDRYMRSKGFYSSYVVPESKEVVLIVLNTTQWMRPHLFIPEYPNQSEDAQRQLDWLRNQLATHQAKQVLIAMHAPPGNDYKGNPFWKKKYLAQFITILEEAQKFQGQISLITSHTHMDEVRALQLKEGKSIYAYSTPAVSRIYYNNPGIKIFDLDDALRLKNYTTFYTTNSEEWGSDHYQALGTPDAIFPKCTDKTLADCLSGLSDEDVCTQIEAGLFYGVKNPIVNNKPCRFIYRVH